MRHLCCTRVLSIAIVFCVFLELSTGIAAAQQPIQISIDATADDNVGKSFVYELKEAIGHSATYRSVDTTSQNEGLSLTVVSLSDEKDTSNNSSSAISAVLVLKLKDQPFPYFLDQWVIHVGFEKTGSMARKMLASIDHDVDEIKKIVNSK